MTLSQVLLDVEEGKGAPRLPGFGPRLKAVREQLGLKQEELARRSGVGQAYISKIEQSKRTPGTPILMQLASGLGISLDDLMGDLKPPAHVPRPADAAEVEALKAELAAANRRQGAMSRKLASAIEEIAALKDAVRILQPQRPSGGTRRRPS